MAVVTAVVRNVDQDRGNDDARSDAVALAVGNLKRCYLTLDNNSVIVNSGDTLAVNIATAIQNSTRNGKTVTIQGCPAIIGALTTVTTLGVEVTAAGFATLSTNTLSILPKSDGYVTGSTNVGIAALPTVRPYIVYVAYTEA